VNENNLKKSNSNDKLDAQTKEDIEQSWNRKEAEKREQEWREEAERREQEYKQLQQRKYDASNKLIGFIQDKLQVFSSIEYQKKILSFHGAFNSMKLFQEIDSDHKGYLTSENFKAYFGDNEDFASFNFLNLIKHLNGGHEEDRLSYVELQDALTPYSSRG
jgi:hypothetical protein